MSAMFFSSGAVAAKLALEEILVTAEKRESSLQDTPISLLAFSSERLERFGVSDLGDIAGLAPNVTITPFPNSRSSLVVFIRGVGNNDSQTTQDPAVGVYIDGVYIARSVGLTSDIADLERIEVLRGPQGTLYGRNTTGGAINLITAKPGEEFGFSQSLSAGNRDYLRSLSKFETGKLEMAGMGAVAAKLSYMSAEHSGWVENTGEGDNFGEEDKEAGRLALRWDLSESLTVDYAYDFSDIDGPQHFYQTTQSDGVPPADAERRDSGSWNGGVEPSVTRIKGHSLIATWDSPLGTLTSISALRELEEQIVQDYGGGAPGFRINVALEQEQFSQELQLVGELASNWRYVAGLYYFEEEALELEQAFVPAVLPNPIPSMPPTVIQATLEDRRIASASEAYAAYGQVSWAPGFLDQRLELTLGGRYSVDKREASKDSDIYFVAGEQSDSNNWSNFNPSVVADFSWTESLSTFAKVVTAYKSGGYNVRSTEEGFQPPFDEEHLISYELGLKSTWFANRLSLNAAVFRADYEDMQLQQITNNATIFLTDVFNVGKARLDGAELDLMAVLAEGLTLQLSYGYTDADFVEYIDQRGGSQTEGENIAGQAEMPYAPEHNYTVGLEYQRRISAALLSASVDYQWSDERYGTALNDDMAGFFLDDYGLINTRLALSGLYIGGAELSCAVFVRNLSDEEYKVHSISLGTHHAAYYGEPRSYGFDLKLSF